VIRAAVRLNRCRATSPRASSSSRNGSVSHCFRRQGARWCCRRRPGAAGTRRATAASGDEAESELRDGPTGGAFRLGVARKHGRKPPAGHPSRFHRAHPGSSSSCPPEPPAPCCSACFDYRLEAASSANPSPRRACGPWRCFEEELVLITAKACHGQARADLFAQHILAFAQGCSYRKRLRRLVRVADVPARTRARVRELSGDHRLRRGGNGLPPSCRARCCRAQRASATCCSTHAQAGARQRTHLVWSGEASPALAHLIGLLPTPKGAAAA